MKTQIIIAFLAVLVAVTYCSPVETKIEGEDYGLKKMEEIAKKYGKLIEKEGLKAWHFLECMGEDLVLHPDCIGKIGGCAGTANIVGCVEAVFCSGKAAKGCASKLK